MTDERTPVMDTEPSQDGERGYRVALPTFEGPLDLLLHLIQKHELNILDIPIAFVTEKYLEYVRLMEVISIDVASEYLVMAATLVHIKSRMLLPSPPVEDEAGEIEEDPRFELIRRLLEYQKYKVAAEQLGGRTVLGRDVFGRGLPMEAVEGLAPLAPVGVFQLFDAFRGVLERAKVLEDHSVDVERITVQERIGQVADRLRALGRIPFERLFEEDRTRLQLVVTFLALLEMTRLRLTRVFQTETYGPIEIELSVVDDDTPEADVPAAFPEDNPVGTRRGDPGGDEP